MTAPAALARGLDELALDLPPSAPAQLLRYLALLQKWNRAYNLTAIRDPERMVSHHLMDSLAVVPHLALPEEDPTMADVGSGGGLPGIALAIARPQWRITLNDSSQKKAAFLRQTAIELKLSNVQIHEGRVEAWRPRPPFAVVISRAFAELRAFVEACRHLVKPGGVLAAMTGTVPADALGGRVVRLRVPLLDAQRHLVLCAVSA